MSTYRKLAATTGVVADSASPQDELLQCTQCGGMAARKVLAVNGSICSRCFRGYLDQGVQQYGVFTPDDKRAIAEKLGAVGQGNPMAWAHILKAREATGEILSPMQKRMWRGALGVV